MDALDGLLKQLQDVEMATKETIRRSREEQEQQSQRQKIPRHEQDEDMGRFERPIPGRDPVTEERGMGG
jgi:hypothetical protein